MHTNFYTPGKIKKKLCFMTKYFIQNIKSRISSFDNKKHTLNQTFIMNANLSLGYSYEVYHSQNNNLEVTVYTSVNAVAHPKYKNESLKKIIGEQVA